MDGPQAAVCMKEHTYPIHRLLCCHPCCIGKGLLADPRGFFFFRLRFLEQNHIFFLVMKTEQTCQDMVGGAECILSLSCKKRKLKSLPKTIPPEVYFPSSPPPPEPSTYPFSCAGVSLYRYSAVADANFCGYGWVALENVRRPEKGTAEGALERD